jgi:hypothetical protein
MTYHFSSPRFWLSINIVPQLHDTQRGLDGELSAEQKLCWRFLSNRGVTFREMYRDSQNQGTVGNWGPGEPQFLVTPIKISLRRMFLH